MRKRRQLSATISKIVCEKSSIRTTASLMLQWCRLPSSANRSILMSARRRWPKAEAACNCESICALSRRSPYFLQAEHIRLRGLHARGRLTLCACLRADYCHFRGKGKFGKGSAKDGSVEPVQNTIQPIGARVQRNTVCAAKLAHVQEIHGTEYSHKFEVPLAMKDLHRTSSQLAESVGWPEGQRVSMKPASSGERRKREIRQLS